MRWRELVCKPQAGQHRELPRDEGRVGEPGARRRVVRSVPHAGRAHGGGVQRMTGNGGGGGGGGGEILRKETSAGERDAQQTVVLVRRR
jgi:hypothetical protein